jgi:hypothetical protein
MSPITHFLVSWTVAERVTTDRRERLWICLAGLAPDLDGFGIIPDMLIKWRGLYSSQYFAVWHHFLFHGIFGALVTVLISRLAGVRRIVALGWVFVAFHLHLLCDLVGARGPAWYDIWVIYYLGPFTHKCVLYWSHQWPLNGWQNFLFTVVLVCWFLRQAIQNGASPVSVFNARWDKLVVSALRARRSRLGSRT